MKFVNPVLEIESLTDLDIVLEVSTHSSTGHTTSMTNSTSTDFNDSDFGF